jgi:hypothetical protein
VGRNQINVVVKPTIVIDPTSAIDPTIAVQVDPTITVAVHEAKPHSNFAFLVLGFAAGVGFTL